MICTYQTRTGWFEPRAPLSEAASEGNPAWLKADLAGPSKDPGVIQLPRGNACRHLPSVKGPSDA